MKTLFSKEDASRSAKSAKPQYSRGATNASMRKFVSLLLVIVLVGTMVPALAFATGNEEQIGGGTEQGESAVQGLDTNAESLESESETSTSEEQVATEGEAGSDTLASEQTSFSTELVPAATSEENTVGTLDDGTWEVNFWLDASKTDLYHNEEVMDGALAEGPTDEPTDTSGTFVGWYLDLSDATPVDLNTKIIDADFDFIAKFSSEGAVVQFRNITGDILSSKTLTGIATVGAITPLPTDTEAGLGSGTHIEYWYLEGTDGTSNYLDASNASTEISGVITLCPKVAGMYTVYFDTQFGTPINPVTVPEGGKVVRPTDPVKNGYELKHWSKTPGGEAYDFDDSVNASMTLYAVWQPATNVGFHLVYHTSSYQTYQLPDDRANFSSRATIVVTAEEDKKPVGSTLTAAEIKTLALKYLPDAAKKSSIIKYICEYYENASKSMPLQNGVLNANGNTTINVYFTPPLIDITFDLTAGGVTDAFIEHEGTVYSNDYTVPANYNMYVSEQFPDAYALWPYDENIRAATEGAIVKRPGYSIVAWQATSPSSVAGASFQRADSSGDAHLPTSMMPTIGNIFSELTLVPLWEEDSKVLLLNYARYAPALYSEIQDIEDNPDLAKDFESLTFESEMPKYIKFEGEYYTHNPNYDYSLNISKDKIEASWNMLYNASPISSATEANRFFFGAPTYYTAKFNALEGSWPVGTTEADYYIQRQYHFPILLDKNLEPYEPPTPIAPTGMRFEGWYTNTTLTTPLDDTTIKSNNDDQTFYAKYVELKPEVTFYDSAEKDTQIGSSVSVNYNQSFDSASKTLPASPAVGDVVAGKGDFNGWYFMLDGKEYEFTTSMPLTEASYEVYATYKQVQYSVTFYDENEDPTGEVRQVWSDPTGAGKNTITQGGGNNRRMPTLANQTGYVACWTTEPNGNGEIFTGASLVTSNMKVYAYYDELVTINYETLTGGTGLTRSSETIPARFGTALGAEVSTMSGYEFAGWFEGAFLVGATPLFVPEKNLLTNKYEAANYTAKFNAVITYQSIDTTLGVVSLAEEKPLAGNNAGVAGSTASAVGANSVFVRWIDSHGIEVSTSASFVPLAKPESYTAIFRDPASVVITYEVVPQSNNALGGTTSPVAESIFIGTGVASGSTASPYSGFEFDFWAASPGGTPLSTNPSYVPTKPGAQWLETTYYAHFKEAGTITINYQVGTGRGTLAPTYENVLPLSGTATGSTPTALAGYSFDKWTTDAAGANEDLTTGANDSYVPVKETVSGNEVYVARTYYAHFEEDEVAIAYAVGTAGGGTISNDEDTVLAESGDASYLAGSTPTPNTGYTFEGWALDAAGVTPVDTSWVDAQDKLVPGKEASGSGYDIYKPATYYAIFAPMSFEIIYDANGGTGSIANQDVDYDDTFKTNDGSALSRTGYHLAGWNTLPQGGTSGVSYDLATTTYTYKSTSDTTLYAQWDPNTNTDWKIEHYRVSAAGTTSLYETEKRTGITNSTVTASYRNYSGAGYSPAPSDSRTLASGTVAADGSLVLRLYYTENTYTVTFVDWNGVVLASRTNLLYGSSALAPANPTRIGYSFTGWDKAFTNVTSNLVVNARYTANAYTVTFVDWNGTVLSSQSVNYGGSASAPGNPTRTGYTFTGWDRGYTNVTSNITVTAQYTPVESFTITFLGYNDVVLQTSTVERGGSVTPPADPTRTDYRFDGWDKPSSAWTNVTADATITAQWTDETITTTPVTTEIETPVVPPTQEILSAAAAEQGIPSIGVPLAAPAGFAAWALANLLLAALGVVMVLVFAIVRRVKKNDDEDEAEREERRKQREAQYAQTGIYTEDNAEPVKRRKSLGWLIAAIVLALAGVVLFVLTQDISLPMVWVDFWTIINAILLIATIVVGNVSLGRKKTKQEEDTAAPETA